MASAEDMLALLRRATEAGELVAVDEVVHVDLPEDAEALVFRFERATLSVIVNPDDDTLAVQDGAVALGDGQSLRASVRGGAWTELVHRHLRWAWLLTNQQGYLDGVQLELANQGEAKGSVVQLIAAASSIKVYEVNR